MISMQILFYVLNVRFKQGQSIELQKLKRKLIVNCFLFQVIFLKTLKRFEEIDTYHFLVNRRVKVNFENEIIQQAFNELLEHSCSLCPGRKPFRSFINLKDHMRRDHNLYYCDLCVNNFKVRTHSTMPGATLFS